MKCNKPINVGDTAPDFSLKNQEGAVVRLSEFRGKKNVVLYFYPKDNTRYCIVESTSFRDRVSDFEGANAVIMGVSSDGPSTHRQFAQEFNLPFILLSDETNAVRKSFGVPATFGLIPGRVTYVIDTSGVVRHIFNSQFDPKSHVKQALAALTAAKP